MHSSPVVGLVSCAVYLMGLYLARWFPAFGMVRVLMGMMILIYASGASARFFLQKVLKWQSNLPALSLGGVTCDCLLSALLNVTVSVVLIRIFLFYEVLLVGTTIGLMIVLTLGGVFAGKQVATFNAGEPAKPRKPDWELVLALIILVASSILFGIYFRRGTPFPSINGWDIHSSLGSVYWILGQHGYHYLLAPAYPPSALAPYPALFFYLVASYSLFLGVDPFYVYWFSPYFLIFCYMALVFLLSLGFSRNSYVSLTSAFLAFFGSAGFAEVVRTPLYLTLDLVAQLFFLLIMVFYVFYHGSGRRALIVISIVYLTVLNFYTALVALPFLFLIAIDRKVLPFFGNGHVVFRVATGFMAFGVPLFIGISSSLNTAFANFFSPQDLVFPLSLKLRVFSAIYQPYFLVLVLLSLGSMVVRHMRNHKVESHYVDMLLYASACLIIYFYPAYITYRIEFYLRVFMAVYVSGLLPNDVK